VDYFKRVESSVIMCHHEPSLEKLQRTGVIEVDNDFKVLMMQEKPKQPVSNWAVPPFYIYAAKDLPLIRDCMNHGCGFDAPGNLAHYLVGVTTLYAWKMPGGRLDIGSLDSYHEAMKKYEFS
jgi:glucose-1-phosphate thymidylyltransferase